MLLDNSGLIFIKVRLIFSLITLHESLLIGATDCSSRLDRLSKVGLIPFSVFRCLPLAKPRSTVQLKYAAISYTCRHRSHRFCRCSGSPPFYFSSEAVVGFCPLRGSWSGGRNRSDVVLLQPSRDRVKMPDKNSNCLSIVLSLAVTIYKQLKCKYTPFNIFSGARAWTSVNFFHFIKSPYGETAGRKNWHVLSTQSSGLSGDVV